MTHPASTSNTCSRLLRDSRGGILQREPTTPKHPGPRARCTVVGQRSQEDGHTGRCERTEATEATSDGGGQKRNVGEESTGVNGSPDMGPGCDLKRACFCGGQTWSDGAGRERNVLPLLVLRRTANGGRTCQGQAPPGFVGRGRRPAKACHSGVSYPTPANTGRHSTTTRRSTASSGGSWKTVTMIIGKQSAQLHQWAAWAVRRALQRTQTTHAKREAAMSKKEN